MIIVYGANWCEDTRRARRHLRRLGVAHRYLNIDDDLDALERAVALNGGKRRTPTIDLGLGGQPLVEPDNDTLTGALVEMDMLTAEAAHERLSVQNVGDFERVLRTLGGAALLIGASRAPRPVRWPMRIAGAMMAFSGVTGWCPWYQSACVTSLDGPGDRPDEAHRRTWLTSRAIAPRAAEVPADAP